jgi:hypothetical protein
MRPSRLLNLCLVALAFGVLLRASAQTPSSRKNSQPAAAASSGLDAGVVGNGVYRNKTLGLSCKIPAGWALRTEEMNSAEDESAPGTDEDHSRAAPDRTAEGGCPHKCSKVLLAAFSRPPEARGEDVNSSILIAAESVTTYPGLKEAAQYFGPLTEVAKAQGFGVDEEPYEFALGMRKLVRADFHKDVGTRVMRQSTLVFLSHGYAVSITVIGGTEDEVEELIDGVSLASRP